MSKLAGLADSLGGRRYALALMYLSEGGPIGYLWWALPTKLRAADVPVEEVAGLAALLTVPWTFKFLWAPLVDVFRSSRFGVKPWIVGAQTAMAATLLPLAFLDLLTDYRWVVGFLLVHAFCAATQDAAIDAFAIRTVPPDQRGAATGWMQTGMLTGRAVFGGAALMLEARLGQPAVILALVGTILSTMGVVLALPDRGSGRSEPVRESLVRVWQKLVLVLGLRATWIGIALAAVSGAGMEAAGALAGPLMVDIQFSQEEVGRFFAFPAVAAMALGALVGGRYVDRVRRTTGVKAAVVLVAVVVVGVAGAASAGSAWGVLVLLTLVYLLFGVLTASLYALLMDLTDPALGGTQFSTYMAAVNLCYVWSAAVAGQLAGAGGYALALSVMAALSLLTLPLLSLLRTEGSSNPP